MCFGKFKSKRIDSEGNTVIQNTTKPLEGKTLESKHTNKKTRKPANGLVFGNSDETAKLSQPCYM